MCWKNEPQKTCFIRERVPISCELMGERIWPLGKISAIIIKSWIALYQYDILKFEKIVIEWMLGVSVYLPNSKHGPKGTNKLDMNAIIRV